MPRSKKPRKKYRPKVSLQLRGAEVLDDFCFRIEDWGAQDWQIAARMHLLTPFDNILRGTPTETDWAQAKTNLIEGWATASEFEERDRIRREIRAANKLLAAAYSCFDQKHEVLARNVEAARDEMNRKELAVLLGFQTDKSSAFDDLLSQPGFPLPMSLSERTKRWNVKEVSDFMKALRARNRGERWTARNM